jgi:hypothetical protein
MGNGGKMSKIQIQGINVSKALYAQLAFVDPDEAVDKLCQLAQDGKLPGYSYDKKLGLVEVTND